MGKYNLFFPFVEISKVVECRTLDRLSSRQKWIRIEIRDMDFPIPCRADKRILFTDREKAEKALFCLALGGTVNGVKG